MFLLCSIAVGNGAASSLVRNVTIPDDCSATSPPPSGKLTLRGNNYFLLPGLKFADQSCQPSITSFSISGEGNFSISLLEMEKSLILNMGIYYQVKSQLLCAAQRDYLYKITSPFPVDADYNSIIALAIYCKPAHGDCVFQETFQKSARYSDTFFANPVKDGISYVTFPPHQKSTHPVFSLSLSCK